MAALTDLKLFGPDVEYLDEFFRQSNRTNNPWFLPQLQVLEYIDVPPFVNTVLLDALSSRCAATQGGDARLRCFRQIWVDDTPAEALQINVEKGVGPGLALAALKKNEIDIYIGPSREI